MMNEEYIIDGTSIICNAEKEKTLAPLLQLLFILKNRGDNFYCYFDADTRYKFEKDIDKQLYQNIIKFGLEEYFIQVSSLDADLSILEQAQHLGAKVISCDNFESYTQRFPWLIEQKQQRLIPLEVIAQQLIAETILIDTQVERDVIKITTTLIHTLEKEAGRLNGLVNKYKKERQFGFIKRDKVGKNIFFSKKSVTDSDLNFTIIDTPVSFNIEIGQSGNIYYFGAANVRQQETHSTENIVDQLKNDNKILQATKTKIQEQTAKANALIQQQLIDIQAKNKILEENNQILQEQIDVYRGSNNQTIQRLQKRKDELKTAFDQSKIEQQDLLNTIQKKDKEIKELKAQLTALSKERDLVIVAKQKQENTSNELALVVDVQQQKIQNLDQDLRSTLQMFEFQDLDSAENAQFQQLKKDYDIAVKALRLKNSKIVFLTNNINDLRRQLSLNTEQKTGKLPTDFNQLIERIQELERNNASLSEKIKTISTKKTTQRKRLKTKEKQESNHSDSELTAIPSSSRPTKLDHQPIPKIIEEIPINELRDWWYNLNEDWQKAFNQGVLSRGEMVLIPSEEQLRSIFERKKIDIVGSGILLYGLNQLSFKLTELSGLKDLKQITELNLSGHDFTDIENLETFPHLELLNCTSNRISTLRNIKRLKNLKTLIIRDNDLINFDGIEDMEELEYINALYNQKLRSIAGVEDLENLQVLCVPNYKTKIIRELKKLQKVNPTIEVRNV